MLLAVVHPIALLFSAAFRLVMIAVSIVTGFGARWRPWTIIRLWALVSTEPGAEFDLARTSPSP